MALQSLEDLRSLIFKVTPHARQRFRERVDGSLSDDQIDALLYEAWRSARRLAGYSKGGARYAGAGLVFGAARRCGVTTVVTVHEREEEFKWNRTTFRRAAARGAMHWH